MNQQHSEFFNEYGAPFNQEQTMENDIQVYYHNVLVLEVANNFKTVRWLMHRYTAGLIKEVDPLEKSWMDFLLGNSINILEFEKNDYKKFINKYFKSSIIKDGWNVPKKSGK